MLMLNGTQRVKCNMFTHLGWRVGRSAPLGHFGSRWCLQPKFDTLPPLHLSHLCQILGCKAPNSALGDTQVSRGQYQNPTLPSFTGHISDSLSSAASLENLVGGGRILRVNVIRYAVKTSLIKPCKALDII